MNERKKKERQKRERRNEEKTQTGFCSKINEVKLVWSFIWIRSDEIERCTHFKNGHLFLWKMRNIFTGDRNAQQHSIIRFDFVHEYVMWLWQVKWDGILLINWILYKMHHYFSSCTPFPHPHMDMYIPFVNRLGHCRSQLRPIDFMCAYKRTYMCAQCTQMNQYVWQSDTKYGKIVRRALLQ